MAPCLPLLAVVLLAWGLRPAGADQWVVGGGHRPWSEFVERSIGLDDSTVAGAIQPYRVRPGENVLRHPSSGSEPEKLTGLFGYIWGFTRGELYRGYHEQELGWNPRLWSGGAAEATGSGALVDGIENAPALFVEAPTSGRPTGDYWFTVDLGIPVPVDSVAFFPPQTGLHPTLGRLYRDLFPRGYAVSRSVTPVSWLMDEAEPYDTGRSSNYHPLSEVVGQTFGNARSVVGLSFPLRFTRFVRVYFGGVVQTYSLAELKAFGRGFPAQTRYTSRPFPPAAGMPVSYGRISWHVTPLRLQADGSVVEDQEAPVAMELHTRTGSDDDPREYHVYDELGKLQVVSRTAFTAAPAPTSPFQIGSAGTRGSVTEDAAHWDPWSSAYERPGEEVRSADGMAYLQFRFELQTADPLACARLDSITVEYSRLLAASVVGEVSVPGQVATGVPRLPVGVDTVLVYDLQASFDSADQPGFDGLELDVPPGTELLGMEMGRPPVAVEPDSVVHLATDRIRVLFPSHRVGPQSNAPLRLRLRGAIFQASAYFTGQVLATDRNVLPQTIASGDANPEVASNTFQVVAAETRLPVLRSVHLSPRTVTPNGDGANDQTRITYALLGVERAAVTVEVLDLSGRALVHLRPDSGAAGQHVLSWDGRDADGQLVRPGIYLVRVEADVDEGKSVEVDAVCVAY
ncbi:MAG: FlgD immunoglobulin-like domain containing protein [Candidatus Latescibacterota bacterium]